MNNRIKKILKIVKAGDIRFIRLWFVDILGQLKSFSISQRELEHALKDGMGFDGSSVEGFARVYESDLVAVPDPETFGIMSGKFDKIPAARMFCDIMTPDGKHYAGDTRYVLKKNLEIVKKMGFSSFMVGPELEYFYFKNETTPETLDKGGYFDTVPLDESHDLRRETILVLEQLGIPVEYSHHEVAPGQHEIDLRYSNALTMADRVITYKVVAKQIASAHQIYASFMPKPLTGINGSGMHVHMSLFAGKRNAFFNPKGDFLSPVAKHFTAGVLKHVREICVISNQWVNSYKRLVPGFEAPVYIAWAKQNRSALIRVPQYRVGHEESTRIECRFPDPACNPYLTFSVLLAAGLDGIKNRLTLPKPVEADIYEMDEIERKAKRIETLPGSLIEALEAAEKSVFLKEVLGEHVFEKFIENKKIEWNDYRTKVTDYEIKKYLPIL